MSALSNRDQLLRDIKTAIFALAGVPENAPSSLSGSGIMELRRTMRLARGCRVLPFDEMLETHIDRLSKYAVGTLHFANRLTDFGSGKLSSSDHTVFARDWEGQFEHTRNFMVLVADAVSYLLFMDPEVESIRGAAERVMNSELTKLSTTLSSAKENSDKSAELLGKLEKVRGELDTYAKNIAGIEAARGAQENNTFFATEADKHAQASIRWLVATISMTIVGVAAAFLFLREFPLRGNWGDANVVEALITRVITLTALFGGAAWCGGLYRARAHLASVNSHRAVAVQTLELFLASTIESGVRDKIILATARLVYSDTTSGLLGNDVGLAGKLAEKAMDVAARK